LWRPARRSLRSPNHPVLRIEGHAGEVPDRAGGHQVWSTVGSPLKKAPMEGITIAGVCVVLEMATFPGSGSEGAFGAECLAAADWRASSGERVCGHRCSRYRRTACRCDRDAFVRIIQRCVVGDVKRLGIRGPGGCIAHAADGRRGAAGDTVDIEELAHWSLISTCVSLGETASTTPGTAVVCRGDAPADVL